MSEALRILGIPPRMMQYILALYANPTAKVRVNGHLSNAFAISNGTRQGCPLSPIIFVLTLEPLLRRLRSNPDIKGIDIKSHTYKIAAYADDILLFLTEPLITLPNLLKDFHTFHYLTNLKINFTKSDALNITLPPDLCTQCQTNFPFKWNNCSIRYLGIQLPSSLSDLYSTNYLPLIHNIVNDLKKWSTGLFTWFGRAAVVKMNILPRLLYLLQTVPIRLPPAFFAIYRRTCSNFIWGRGRG